MLIPYDQRLYYRKLIRIRKKRKQRFKVNYIVTHYVKPIQNGNIYRLRRRLSLKIIREATKVSGNDGDKEVFSLLQFRRSSTIVDILIILFYLIPIKLLTDALVVSPTIQELI